MNPYKDLILNAIPQWKEKCHKITHIRPLSGGITNTNFRVEFGGKTYVVRIYGIGSESLGIHRPNEILCHRIAAELEIAPNLFEELSSSQTLVSQFVDGQTLDAAGAASSQHLSAIVKAVKKYHGGPKFPGTFSPFQTVRNYLKQAQDLSVEFPAPLDDVLEKMDLIEKTLMPHVRLVPCHNDLLAANFIDDEKNKRLWILDWEYAAMGDCFFDLGNFAVNQSLNPSKMQQLLDLYFENPTEWHMAYLELMCRASDLRESFWAFLQTAISKLDFDYDAYAIRHYERFRDLARDEQLQGWLSAVASGAKPAPRD